MLLSELIETLIELEASVGNIDTGILTLGSSDEMMYQPFYDIDCLNITDSQGIQSSVVALSWPDIIEEDEEPPPTKPKLTLVR